MKSIKLTGRRFGRLIVVGFNGRNKWGQLTWLCKCKCGKETVKRGIYLLSGHTKSCGCFQNECRRSGYPRRTHGMTGTTEYRIWSAMKNRCLNPRCERFKDYGGRGITVCKRWMKFENFLADMGKRPSALEIDRIENEKGYSKSNCRWATRTEQANNKRTNRLLEINGDRRTISEWGRIVKIQPSTIFRRMKLGWTPAEAVSQPSSLARLRSKEIYSRIKSGETHKSIAAELNVSRTFIGKIYNEFKILIQQPRGKK